MTNGTHPDVVDQPKLAICQKVARATNLDRPWYLDRTARRGATIVEALLYLSVAIGVIAFSGRILQDEQTRQRNQIIASDVQMMVDTMQLYVAQSYDTILGDLFDATSPGGSLVGEFAMDRLVSAGFLADMFSEGTGSLRAIYGHDYAVLHRAVLRSAPDDTVVKTAEIESNLAQLTDGVFTEAEGGDVTNDELDLEVVLVSRQQPAGDANPKPIEPQNGSRIIELTGRAAAGYVPTLAIGSSDDEQITARGAFGGWALSLEPYEGLPSAPDAEGGVIASIISLPVTGVVSVLVDARDRENLSRCSDLPPNSSAYSECLAASSGNQLFSDLVFNAWDSDGDGVLDRLPSIQGLHQIVFGSAADTDNDGAKDSFPGIDGLQRIDFAGAVPITDDEDVTTGSFEYSEVTNLFAISCHAADNTDAKPAAVGASDQIQINCPTTRLTGTVVAESATLNGLLETNELIANGPTTISGTAAFKEAATFDQDVLLKGELTMPDNSTDLLDNVPIWSRKLSFTFVAQASNTSVVKTIDTSDIGQVSAPLPGTCPTTRSQRLEYTLVGYKLEIESEIDRANTDIDQIYLSGSDDRFVSVTLGGKWAKDVTVDVLAQIFCR